MSSVKDIGMITTIAYFAYKDASSCKQLHFIEHMHTF